jgi:Acetyltransferase (GNAT) domain
VTATISLLAPPEREELRRFLAARVDAVVFHHPEWHDVIEAAYGHACDYWVARVSGDLVGAFPVVNVRVPGLGRKMVAIGYQMHAGLPLADDVNVKIALVRAALERAGVQKARHLEIRHAKPAPWLESLGFTPLESGLVVTTVPLADISLTSIRRNHRRSVRAAEGVGVTIRRAETLADLRLFRDLYLREGRAQGAPKAPWSYFAALHRILPNRHRLFLAFREENCLGGMLTVEDGRMVFARHAAYSTPEALAAHLPAALYWHAMADASARGIPLYNCGLTWQGDPGLIHWKEGWGGTHSPMILSVHSSGPIRPPGSYFEGYGLARAAWKRLPLWAVDMLGGLVTRWIC